MYAVASAESGSDGEAVSTRAVLAVLMSLVPATHKFTPFQLDGFGFDVFHEFLGCQIDDLAVILVSF